MFSEILMMIQLIEFKGLRSSGVLSKVNRSRYVELVFFELYFGVIKVSIFTFLRNWIIKLLVLKAKHNVVCVSKLLNWVMAP